MIIIPPTSSKYSSDAGYTLLELAIALLIIGMITAGLFQGYTIYQRQQQIRTTNDNIAMAIAELQRFKDLYGFFPCPAPLTAPKNDDNYGRSTSCTDTSVAPGTVPASGGSGVGGLEGISVVNSARTVTDENGIVYTPRIRIGALPFRDINIPEKTSYDGYGSRLVYALTERNGDLDTYSDLEGGIGVVDSNGATGESMVNPPNSAVFALVSPGRDRSGAVDQLGNFSTPCDPASPEGENCDLGTNAIFRSIPESNAAGSQYDDRISFFTPTANTLWVRVSSSEEDIIDTNPGNVGVGNLNPIAKLDIADSSSTVDEYGNPKPEGTLRASEKIKTDIVCPSTDGTVGANTNCFEPRNIAGDNTANPADNTPGDGMKCPAGQYMNGIQDGRAICSAVAIRCSGNLEMMTGVNTTTGAPICTTIPCTSQSATICGTTRTLASGASNTTQTITGGASRVQTYTCQANGAGTAVNWVETDSSGLCTCTPTETTTARACGAGYSGNYTITRTTTCPDGTTTTTNNRATVCTAANCIAQDPQVSSAACPTNFTGGPIVTTRTWHCAPSPGWTTTTSGTCNCAPRVPNTQTITVEECPAGLEGAGTQQAQRWDLASCSWVNDGPSTTDCRCDPTETRTTSEDPACEPSEHVTRQATIREVRDGANCTWNTRTVIDPGTCAPNNYRWKIVGSSGSPPVTGRVGQTVNGSCSYNDYLASGTTTTCSQNLSGNLYMVHDCICQP